MSDFVRVNFVESEDHFSGSVVCEKINIYLFDIKDEVFCKTDETWYEITREEYDRICKILGVGDE